MKQIIIFLLLGACVFAQNMYINTPYRGSLYEEVKPFMEELFHRNGYELVFQKLPLKRGLINANSGMDDGDGPRVKEVENKFPNLLRVETPILQISIHAYYKKKYLKIGRWADLKPFHVGVRTGTLIQVNNVKKANPDEIIYVDTNEKLFKLLEEKKVDVIIMEKVMARDVKQKMKLEDISMSPALLRKNKYLFLNKKHANRVQGFNKTLLQMKKEGYQDRLKDFYEIGKSSR